MSEQQRLPFADDGRFEIVRVEVWAVKDRKTGAVVACRFGATRYTANAKAVSMDAARRRTSWKFAIQHMCKKANGEQAQLARESDPWRKWVANKLASLKLRTKFVYLPKGATTRASAITWRKWERRAATAAYSSFRYHGSNKNPWVSWFQYTAKNSARRAESAKEQRDRNERDTHVGGVTRLQVRVDGVGTDAGRGVGRS